MQPIKLSDLTVRDGLYYAAGQTGPFTGDVVDYFQGSETEQISYRGFIQEGRKFGQQVSLGYQGEIIASDYVVPLEKSRVTAPPELRRVSATLFKEGGYCDYYLTFVVSKRPDPLISEDEARAYLQMATPTFPQGDCTTLSPGFTVNYLGNDLTSKLYTERIGQR